MKFLTNKSLLSKAKFMWKTLVVLILSVLLFNPTPALAFNLNNFVNSIKSGDLNQTVNELQKVDLNKIDLNKVDLKQVVDVVNDINNTVNPPANVAPSLDYNKELQSYISKLKVDFDRILDSIRKLSSLPEKEGQESLATIESQLQELQEGQESLATIESQLQELQNYSSSRATQFDTWSSEQEKKYKELLNNINTMYREEQVLTREVKAKEAELPLLERQLGLEGSEYQKAYDEYQRLNREIQDNLVKLRLIRMELDELQFDPFGIKSSFNEDIRELEAKNQSLEPRRNDLKSRFYRISTLRNAVKSKQSELVAKQSRIETLKRNQTKLESDKQKIASAVVLANEMSSFCNKAKEKIDSAKQKSETVTEYADALLSFSDPDILGEIRELEQLIVDLTKNLAWKA
ncbi:hypothetical protein [Nodularia spumigena]|uniref:Chromosome partition protein Smc n=1 Tax=Nodularia spumigena UHCC 0039 TaxID=1914872 RepID=A0A2S0Q8K7_NODSP|nr:hypothetical protein [Nodularia spumigena]AVZ30779.1 chromosome partition protein Smc [Nodularia spumigena UHCC 0039]